MRNVASVSEGPASAPPLASRPAVRIATIADLDTVVELRLALLREYAGHPVYGRLRPDAEERARYLFAAQLESDMEAIFVAERDGRIVGIMRCVESTGSPLLEAPRYCYMSSVYVRPEFRRTGVMRALFARAQAWCHDRGLEEIRLHNVPTGVGATAAWDSLGFDVVEHVRLKRL